MRMFTWLLTVASLVAQTPTPGSLQKAMLEDDLRIGLAPAALVRELAIYFPTAADRKFLASYPLGDAPVKPKAFERVGEGYRLTLANGRVASFTPRGDGVAVNGAPVPGIGAGLRATVDAVTAALARDATARHRWYALPRAEAAPVDLTNAIVMISVFVVAVMEKSAKQGAKSPRITDLINHGIEMCEKENFERVPFTDSRTGRMVAQLQKFSLVDFAHEGSADSCRAKIKDAMLKNNGKARQLGLQQGDLMSACTSAARLTTCVREYRGRMTEQTFAPAAATPGAAH